jgi:hypothetical protein
MIRQLFNVACLVSLLLFGAAVALSVWGEITSTHSVTFQDWRGAHNVFELPPPYVLPMDFAILPLIWLVIRFTRGRKTRRGFPVIEGGSEEA